MERQRQFRIRDGVQLLGFPEWVRPGAVYEGRYETRFPPRDPMQVEIREPDGDGVAWVSSVMVDEITPAG